MAGRDSHEPWSSVSPARQAEILNSEIDDPPVFVGSGGISLPRLVGIADPRTFNGQGIVPGGYAIGVRITIPQSGTLKDIAGCCSTDGSTAVDVGVYNTAPVRQRLWSTGWVPAPAATAGWTILGDPDMAVDEGDQYDFVVTASAGDGIAWVGAQMASMLAGRLPNGYEMDQAGAPFLAWYVDLSGAVLPASLNQASFSPYNGGPGIIGRIEV